MANTTKLVNEIRAEFEAMIKQLQSTDRLVEYLDGTYIPQFSKKYLLLFSKTLNGKRTILSSTGYSVLDCRLFDLPPGTYIASDTPLEVTLRRYGAKKFTLIPKDVQYVVLGRDKEFTLKIVEINDGEIYVKKVPGPDYKARLNRAAVNYLFEIESNIVLSPVYWMGRSVLKEYLKRNQADIDALVDQLCWEAGSNFFSDGFTRSLCAKALLLEDLSVVRFVSGHLKGRVLKPKQVFLEEIENAFEEILASARKIVLFNPEAKEG